MGQRKALALLALLTPGHGATTREQLLLYLWPDSPTARGRNALKQLLYALRSEIGPVVATTASGELVIDRSLLSSDVWEFAAAIEQKDWHAAVDAYAGPFLDGFALLDVPEFEHWLDDERRRLSDNLAHALEELARAADPATAVKLWKRRLLLDPLSGRLAREYFSALVAAGEREAALQYASTYAADVRSELGVDPDRSFAEVVDAVRANGRHLAPARFPGPALDRAEEYEPARVHAASRKRWYMIAAIASATVVIAVFARFMATGARAPESVAVVPFQLILSNGDTAIAEHIRDGLGEEVISALAQSPELRVIGRTSAAQFSGRANLGDVARALGVDAVVTGGIRRERGTLRVTTRIVTADGATVWARAFERDTGQVLLLTQDVAVAVAQALATRRGSASVDYAAATQDAEAYDLYLRAMYALNRRTTVDVRRAIDLFEQAVGRDTNFALAHAMLAQAHLLRAGQVDTVPAATAIPRVIAAAQRALRANERVSEAHAALASVHQLNRDWPAAEHAYRRAIELNPSDAASRSWYAFLLQYTGRTEAALEQQEMAHRLEPVSPGISANLAWTHYFARNYDRAIEVFARNLEIDSGSAAMHNGLGRAYEQLGLQDEALAAYRHALRLSGHGQAKATLAHGLARFGYMEEARALRDDLIQSRSDGFVLAIAYAGLGEADSAITQLERAGRAGTYGVNHI
ncbi:MAG: BTAD domain-containing putative transcriptional regulator, partial [Gemmatimonadaceae bacterium]